MAEAATRSIIQMTTAGKFEDDNIIVPSSIIVRDSTGPVPTT